MRFHVITLFPEFFQSAFQFGVTGQAYNKGLFQLQTVNPRDWSEDIHKTVDGRPFGGGDGMILIADVLEKAILSVPKEDRGSVIYLSPQGKVLNDQLARQYSLQKKITFICGRYGGIDQRFVNQYVDEELSIGDYVLSGGEFAAAVAIDVIVRMLPEVLGNQKSFEQDSFSEGLLECPQFTRPRCWNGQSVPEVLLSGDHSKIENFQKAMGFMKTLEKRPDLIESSKFSQDEQKKFLQVFEKLSDSEKAVLGFQKKPFLK